MPFTKKAPKSEGWPAVDYSRSARIATILAMYRPSLRAWMALQTSIKSRITRSKRTES
jgi:hypothetical protein